MTPEPSRSGEHPPAPAGPPAPCAAASRHWVVESWRSGDETVNPPSWWLLLPSVPPRGGGISNPLHPRSDGRPSASPPHAQRRPHRTGHEPPARARRHLARGLRARRDASAARSAPRAAGRRRGQGRRRALRAHAPGTAAPGRRRRTPGGIPAGGTARSDRHQPRARRARARRARSRRRRASAIGLDGRERARVVRGEPTPAHALARDVGNQPFFRATLGTGPAACTSRSPYRSADTGQWVVSNSALVRDDRGVPLGIVRFELPLAERARGGRGRARSGEPASRSRSSTRASGREILDTARGVAGRDGGARARATASSSRLGRAGRAVGRRQPRSPIAR